MTFSALGEIDLALISLYLFWLFFAGLVIWLQRENMREGYPLEDDDANVSSGQGVYGLPSTKTFTLPHGRGDVTVPNGAPEGRDLALTRTSSSAGSPYEPSGDPLADGVGPASWAPRRDVPELDGHGHPKIVPMRMSSKFAISAGRDPRGMPVVSDDLKIVGTVTDMWIDEPEQLVRYLEFDLSEGGSRLLPMTLARITGRGVMVHSLAASQFGAIPAIKSQTQVTKLEEEKVSAYYCGGKLYAAHEDRLEPQLA
ncbi:MAG: photosynthetic reaction center subunit H [Pseudomonadota bacterium]